MQKSLPRILYVLVLLAGLTAGGAGEPVAGAREATASSLAVTAQTEDTNLEDVVEISDEDYRAWETSLPLPKAAGFPLCFGCGDTPGLVSYNTFSDKEDPAVDLFRYPGRHVTVLAPREWPSDEDLSHDELMALVDQLDILYEDFTRLVGREPRGDGPLTVAFAERTEGAAGRGYLGFKGIELDDFGGAVRRIRDGLANDAPASILIHEMAHNFHVKSSDKPRVWRIGGNHSWTRFWEAYMPVYARWYQLGGKWGRAGGEYVRSPEVHSAVSLAQTWGLASPTTQWLNCPEDDEACGYRANDAWAGLSLYAATLHGPDLVAAAVDAAALSAASGPEEQWLEGLAAATGTNIACDLDKVGISISSALRNRMRQAYGACPDRDRDGYSSFLDCNDDRSDVFPSAPEVRDGLDNDCDTITDNVLVVESEDLVDDAMPGDAGAQFPMAMRVPFTLDGEVPERLDADAVRILFDGPIQIIGCTDGGSGAFLLPGDTVDGAPRVSPLGMYAERCLTRIVVPERTRSGGHSTFLTVFPVNSGPSRFEPFRYRLTVAPMPESPVAADWGAVEASTDSDPVAFRLDRKGEWPGDWGSVSVWVSGLGEVSHARSDELDALTWEPPTRGTRVGVRARLLENGHPVTPMTPLTFADIAEGGPARPLPPMPDPPTPSVSRGSAVAYSDYGGLVEPNVDHIDLYVTVELGEPGSIRPSLEAALADATLSVGLGENSSATMYFSEHTGDRDASLQEFEGPCGPLDSRRRYWKCEVPFDWVVGNEYRLRLSKLGERGGRDLWQTSVTDVATGAGVIIATVGLSQAAEPAFGSVRHVSTQSFAGNDQACASLALRRVRFRGPYSVDGSPLATRAAAWDRASNTCGNYRTRGEAGSVVIHEIGGTVTPTPSGTALWSRSEERR
jgi:hypothetical protein